MIFIVYFIAHCVFIGLNQHYVFTQYPDLSNVIQIQSLQIFIAFIGVIAVARHVQHYMFLLKYIIIGILLYAIYSNMWMRTNGITFDIAVCALLLPLIITKRGSTPEVIAITLTIASAFYFNSRSAYVIFFIQFLYILGKNWKYILWLTPLIYFIFPISTSGRITMWINYMSYWWHNANIWIGTGLGSFHWMGLTMLDSGREAKFFLMHNDWLQILFETGIVGFVSSLCIFWYGTRNLKNKYKLVWITIGVLGLTYYPVHNMLIQIVIGYLLLEKTNPESRISAQTKNLGIGV